jgi:hypothetical protein
MGARETSDEFGFIARVPKQATDRDLVRKFLEGLAAIGEQVLTVVLKILQPLTLIEGREWLDDLLGSCAYTAIPQPQSFVIHRGFRTWRTTFCEGTVRPLSGRIYTGTCTRVVTSDFACLQLSGR